MNINKDIVCIIGESGSGKTSLMEQMEKKGYKEVRSHTTRKSRGEKDDKICVTEEAFMELKDSMVGYTYFDNNHYGTTRENVEKSHLYIIDPEGVLYLADKYGAENIIIVQILTSEQERFSRIFEARGWEEATERIAHDKKAFKKLYEKDALPCKKRHLFCNESAKDFKDNVEHLSYILEGVFE